MPYIYKDGIPVCRKPGVYCITNKVNSKVYVGSAMCLRGRMRGHRTHLRQGRHGNRHLQGAWNKYGEDAFKFDILETCQPSELLELEQKWIDGLDSASKKNGYNICPTAGNCLGLEHTEESRKKMSAAKKGKLGLRTGAVLSEETKAKIRASKLGSKAGTETKAKMSATRTGKKMSEEHRVAYIAGHWSRGPNAAAIAAKIAAGNKGHACSEEKRAKISATKRRASLVKRDGTGQQGTLFN